jgi:hypothetical protein
VPPLRSIAKQEKTGAAIIATIAGASFEARTLHERLKQVKKKKFRRMMKR